MKLTAIITGSVMLAAQSAAAIAQEDQPDCQVETQETQNTQSGTQDSASDKLERCGGVLKPPEAGDAEIVEEPDESGRTPVIPPNTVPEPDSEDEEAPEEQ